MIIINYRLYSPYLYNKHFYDMLVYLYAVFIMLGLPVHNYNDRITSINNIIIKLIITEINLVDNLLIVLLIKIKYKDNFMKVNMCKYCMKLILRILLF